jgi:Nuclease-related domain
MADTAGQSAHREFRRARLARGRSVAARVSLAAAAAAAIGVLWLERGWAEVHRRTALEVLVLAALAVCASGGAAWKAARTDPGRWERAADGERRTAEILGGLPPRRWAVLHDLAIPGSNANVDHLAFGPTGAWLVDTKTTRARIRVGWRSVRMGEWRIDPAPTSWEAEVVADRLGVDVQPLIVIHSTIPGVGLPPRGRRIGQGVRVVSPDGLARRLRRGRRRLGAREVDELYELARAELGPRVSVVQQGGRRG